MTSSGNWLQWPVPAVAIAAHRRSKCDISIVIDPLRLIRLPQSPSNFSSDVGQ